MSIRFEREQRSRSDEEKLSKTEVDREAFTLMDGIRVSLFSIPQFREGLAESFLDLSGDEYEPNEDKPSRRVNFCIGKDRYTVEYSFSRRDQSLMIIKDTLKTDVIILKSRRFEDQKPIRSPEIRYYYPLGSRAVDEPNLQVNNAFALQKAREMLEGLTPQK